MKAASTIEKWRMHRLIETDQKQNQELHTGTLQRDCNSASAFWRMVVRVLSAALSETSNTTQVGLVNVDWI